MGSEMCIVDKTFNGCFPIVVNIVALDPYSSSAALTSDYFLNILGGRTFWAEHCIRCEVIDEQYRMSLHSSLIHILRCRRASLCTCRTWPLYEIIETPLLFCLIMEVRFGDFSLLLCQF